MLRGRALSERDDANAPPVAVVGSAFADRYWPNGADPIGERVVIGGGLIQAFATEPERQIVGIVGDMRAEELNEPPLPTIYVPLAQLSDDVAPFLARRGPLAWLVRTAEDPQALAAAVQSEHARAPVRRSPKCKRWPPSWRRPRRASVSICCS